MRYDVEVSGFPSPHAGHLCLLRLSEDDYPNTTRIEEWPSWDLPILQWGKSQGGVVGFSHRAGVCKCAARSLPTYDMPQFDGIGANEYIVDVVHGACDFISAVDTPAVWELNIWYHTLNCGSPPDQRRDRFSLYLWRQGGPRPGLRQARQGQPLDYDRWVDRLRDGRSYVLRWAEPPVRLPVNGLGVGEQGPATVRVCWPRKKASRSRFASAPRPCWPKAARGHPQPPARPETLLARGTRPHRRH